MNIIKYPPKTDLKKYKLSDNNPVVYYGLPREVRFCKKCLMSNQKPTSTIEFKHKKDERKKTMPFDENGVCDPCKFAEIKKNTIDWTEREKELIDLCNKHRKNDGSYDCLVPGSGGKDSFFASHILKNKYKMHPLTVTWAPHIYTEWGWKNFQSWIHAGHDNYLMTPNGKVQRLLTRLATDILLHPFQPFAIGQSILAPKLASHLNIPLVFYGENFAEYNNPIADTKTPLRNHETWMANEKSDTYFFGGVSVNDLIDKFGLNMNDVSSYLPIDSETTIKKKIEVHYLGYYLKWHPQGCYYYSVENGGFIPSPERTPGTYSKYNSIDDCVDDWHYFTTRIKFGMGRTTYDASQEIRSGEINRDEGLLLLKKYEHEYPKRFEKEFFDYLSIKKEEFPEASKMFEQPIFDKEYFFKLIDQFRSPHLWYFENESWFLRHNAFEKN